MRFAPNGLGLVGNLAGKCGRKQSACDVLDDLREWLPGRLDPSPEAAMVSKLASFPASGLSAKPSRMLLLEQGEPHEVSKPHAAVSLQRATGRTRAAHPRRHSFGASDFRALQLPTDRANHRRGELHWAARGLGPDGISHSGYGGSSLSFGTERPQDGLAG